MRSTDLALKALLLAGAGGAFALLGSADATAQCLLVPTAGNDSYSCVSGASGALVDPGGSNTLLFPAGGSGTINGNVTFGAGVDGIDMQSGTINGNVDQGDGANSFVMGGGTVTGGVQQGIGVDDFVMTGGRIGGSLNQGNGYDTFRMTGGTIVGAFDDGDYAEMTGGSIGRVDMKLADNVFLMSGGTIVGNLVTGLGRDRIEITDGRVGGNVSVSSGVDLVTIGGGEVGGEIRMGLGNDVFTWDGGGTIGGAVLLAADDDRAILRNLDQSILSSTPLIDGGTGTDTLVFDAVTASTVGRYVHWEAVSLTAGSEFTLDGAFVLGNAGTGTGSFDIEAGSTLLAGGGADRAIQSFTAGALADVTNAGTIDLGNDGPSTTDRFTITGNYTGDAGRLLLDAELGDDASPSDRLVVSGGAISGTTGLAVTNIGGAGALTEASGILVVEAADGATSTGGAFSLDGTVAAGAHEYLLFRGGVAAGEEENWYLRSTLVAAPPGIAAPAAAPGAPPLPVPTPAGAPPSAQPPPPAPGASAPIAAVIPIYRPEVPVYAAVPPLAYQLGLATLGTFHERRGEQRVLADTESLSATWGRLFGGSLEQGWSGTVAPSFDGSVVGFQAGLDIFGRDSDTGHGDRAGLFLGYSRLSGDIRGFAYGWLNLPVGDVSLGGTSLGAYWTHIGPGGWYLDAVAMGTWYDGDANSDRGIGVDVNGTGIALSLEAGYPVALTETWTLEPQAQVIWQNLSLDDQNDGFSEVSFGGDDGVTGRVGLRLQGAFQTGGMLLQPYLKANLWHEFDGDDEVSFDGDVITTGRGTTALELGAGIIAELNPTVSVYAAAGYTMDVAGEDYEAVDGTLGFRLRF